MTSGIPKKFFPWVASLRKRWQAARHRAPQDSQAKQYPLGLDPQAVQALRLLVQSPQYPNYLALLEQVTLNNVEQLCRALPHDQYLFYCGVVFACRRLMELPHEVLAKVTEMEDHANARERAAHNARDAVGAAFLNTPWWDSYVRDSVNASGNGSHTDLNALG